MFIKRYIEYIKEVGESNAEPYNYSIEKGKIGYFAYFQTGKFKYTFVASVNNNKMVPAFWTDQGEIETNENKPFRVMSTIVSIIKEILSMEKDINKILFDGKSKEGSDKAQRFDLYMSYVKKNLGEGWVANVNIVEDGNDEIELIRND